MTDQEDVASEVVEAIENHPTGLNISIDRYEEDGKEIIQINTYDVDGDRYSSEVAIVEGNEVEPVVQMTKRMIESMEETILENLTQDSK